MDPETGAPPAGRHPRGGAVQAGWCASMRHAFGSGPPRAADRSPRIASAQWGNRRTMPPEDQRAEWAIGEACELGVQGREDQ